MVNSGQWAPFILKSVAEILLVDDPIDKAEVVAYLKRTVRFQSLLGHFAVIFHPSLSRFAHFPVTFPWLVPRLRSSRALVPTRLKQRRKRIFVTIRTFGKIRSTHFTPVLFIWLYRSEIRPNISLTRLESSLNQRVDLIGQSRFMKRAPKTPEETYAALFEIEATYASCVCMHEEEEEGRHCQ